MVKTEDFNETKFQKRDLESVFEEVNDLFIPDLRSRITNLSKMNSFLDYIDKVLENGFILIRYDDKNNIHGLVTYYANDLITKKAYISLICVRAKFQKRGVGDSLLTNLISNVKNKGMHEIMVKTWQDNLNAINFYKKHGFRIEKIMMNDIILTKEI